MKKCTFKSLVLAMFIAVTIVGTILLTKDKVYAANNDNVDANFPTSYKVLLNKIANEHPNWSFVAVETGLDWNDVINAEANNNRSLMEKTRADILLSKAKGHVKISGTSFSYVPVDGSSWVNTTKAAIAYYMDPRNFINEQYIFQFEALGYSEKYHNQEGVEAILSGTDLENKIISYTTTTGIVETLGIKYSDAIYEAGKKSGISPLFLAAKIRQETGASLKNGSISGEFVYNNVSYKGYYNFFNIGANATATGSAVANGLNYAKTKGWDTPVKAIEGGAEFLAADYIKRGQNTGYFQKFNVVSKPYYGHQYMQNITAATTEGNTTYTAYEEIGIVDKGHVFYIPVYKNMPSQTSKVKIEKTIKIGTMSGATNLRKGPSTSYDKVINIPKDAKVTIDGAQYMEDSASVINRLKYPYWYKVTYKTTDKTYSGYAIANNIIVDVDSKVKVGKTKQLSVTKASGEVVYYETSNPAIATVDGNGLITGVKSGDCQIFAISSAGTVMDSIGINVYTGLIAPKLKSASNVVGGIKVTWEKVEDAQYYVVYRKENGGSWSRINQTSNGNITSYTDKDVESDKTYIYTVRAGQNSTLSTYDTNGVKAIYLESPELDSISALVDSATFSWNSVSKATGYYVYRKTESESWTRINEFKISDLKNGSLTDEKSTIKQKTVKENEKNVVKFSYTDNTVKDGSEYIYTVRAYKGSVTSWYNATGLKISTMPMRTDITSLANASNGVKITWKKVDNLESYAIYRKTLDSSYKRIGTINHNSTISYTDTTAKSGTTYIYTIRTLKNNVFSDYKKEGTTIIYMTRPEFKEIAVKSNAVRLTWNKVTGAKGYYLYRKNASGAWVRIATLKSGSTVQYTDNGREAATKYVYTVRAYNGSYVSAYLTNGVAATTSKAYVEYKTTAKVNYRSNAGTSYSALGTLAKGTKVRVEKGYSKVANGYTWYRILLNNKEYYVASKYLKKI